MSGRLRALLAGRFGRFLLVGGFAALVNFASRFAFNTAFSFRVSVVLAYLVGMVTAWVLSRHLVFGPSGRHPLHELGWFSLVNLAAVAQVWVISVGLAEYVFPAVGFGFHPYAVAHLIGISVPVVTSYLGHKHFSFRRAPR